MLTAFCEEVTQAKNLNQMISRVWLRYLYGILIMCFVGVNHLRISIDEKLVETD